MTENTKIKVWAMWETVENYGSSEEDHLSDGQSEVLAVVDTVEEAEEFIRKLPHTPKE